MNRRDSLPPAPEAALAKRLLNRRLNRLGNPARPQLLVANRLATLTIRPRLFA
jgi:hypothetical protein